MKILFLLSLFIVIYTFVGYGVILYFLVKLKRLFVKKILTVNDPPHCTVIVAAYNEEEVIEEKIINTLKLTYPSDKIKFIFITDGSSDKTPEIVFQYPEII